MNDLPNEPLMRILSFCDDTTKINLSRTSQRFRYLAKKYVKKYDDSILKCIMKNKIVYFNYKFELVSKKIIDTSASVFRGYLDYSLSKLFLTEPKFTLEQTYEFIRNSALSKDAAEIIMYYTLDTHAHDILTTMRFYKNIEGGDYYPYKTITMDEVIRAVISEISELESKNDVMEILSNEIKYLTGPSDIIVKLVNSLAGFSPKVTKGEQSNIPILTLAVLRIPEETVEDMILYS